MSLNSFKSVIISINAHVNIFYNIVSESIADILTVSYFHDYNIISILIVGLKVKKFNEGTLFYKKICLKIYWSVI